MKDAILQHYVMWYDNYYPGYLSHFSLPGLLQLKARFYTASYGLQSSRSLFCPLRKIFILALEIFLIIQ